VAVGLDTFDDIICSPFRRCLQTAGVVARELKIPNARIHIDKAFGEKMHSVRQLQKLVWGKQRAADGQIAYLNESAQLEILTSQSGGVISKIHSQDGVHPAPDEEALAGTQRFVEQLHTVRDTYCCSGKRVLVVAHGDTVDGAVRAFTDETVYIAEECCWVAFSFAEGGEATKLAANRLESMVM